MSEMPPNIALFNTVNAENLTKKSPLLQACINAKVRENGPAAPIMNVVLPNDMFGMYRAATPIPVPAAGPAITPNHPCPPTTSSLIPSHLHPGPCIQIDEFCDLYHLGENIVRQLKENGFTGTQAFHFIETKDLKDMGFKPGEIADLKDAVEAWAMPAM